MLSLANRLTFDFINVLADNRAHQSQPPSLTCTLSSFTSAPGAPRVPVVARAARSSNIREALIERLDNLATTT